MFSNNVANMVQKVMPEGTKMNQKNARERPGIIVTPSGVDPGKCWKALFFQAPRGGQQINKIGTVNGRKCGPRTWRVPKQRVFGRRTKEFIREIG